MGVVGVGGNRPFQIVFGETGISGTLEPIYLGQPVRVKT